MNMMMVRINSNLGDLMTGSFPKTNEAMIRQLLENWAASVRRKDYEGILANHSQEIVMFDLPAPLQSKGLEAYKKTWDLFFGWYKDSPSFEICEMKITAGKDVAFANALMRCVGTQQNGSRSDLDFRLTVGLSKIDDEWVITHEHHSIPAE
jgi:ketosteroid isomerase-like protein